MKKFKTKSLLVLLAGLLLSVAPAQAQSEGPASSPNGSVTGVAEAKQTPDSLLDPNLYMGIEEAHRRTLRMRGQGVLPSQISSLFFMKWQRPLLEEAKLAMWRNRGVEPGDKNRPAGQEPPRVKGPRELALGGIAFSTGEDWVVWLNGQRLTPTAIPKEVIDIQVEKDFVELRWFDSWTNLIYPIRLRPHQRFNLDSRIFLPGTSPL